MRDFEFVRFEQFRNDLRKYADGIDCYTDDDIEEFYKGLIQPQRATRRSSGYDICSPIPFTLAANESMIIPLGIKAYMMEDEELLLFPRSSIGSKFKIRIDNTIGKIDSDYYNNVKNEGHILLFITNTGTKLWSVEAGDAIVQGSFYKYLTTDSDRPRNEERVGGVGSTDKAK